MNTKGKEIRLFAGNSNLPLARRIANCLGIPLGKCEVQKFSDGEIRITLEESVRGMDCFIIQSTCKPVNDNLMEMLILADALHRASATSITAVMPYYGYARQDRKARERDPISAKLVAEMITAANIDRMMTMDLHAQQIQGFFNIPVDHLFGSTVLVNYFSKLIGDDVDDYVILSPDVGSVSRVSKIAKELHDCPMAIVDKRRDAPNISRVSSLVGNVEGKKVILIDDIIDTAGTLRNAAIAAIENGAKSVRAAATHAVLSGKAYENLADAPFEEILLLDTIDIPKEDRPANFRVLSTATYFAHAIKCVHTDESLSKMMSNVTISDADFV